MKPRICSRPLSTATMVLGACLGASAAGAATLTDAVFQEYVYAKGIFHGLGVNDAIPETFTESGTVADESASGYVATAGGALPRAEGAITLTAIGNPTRDMFGSFSARVYYEWTVEQVGGDPYAGPIPIDVRTRGAVDSTVSAGASLYNLWAQASIQLPGAASSGHSARGCVMGRCTYGPISFDDAFSGEAMVDTAYEVVLDALGSGNVAADKATFSISASVDPRIEISPTFGRRDDFRIAFSSGVAPVPEPSEVAMLLAGGLVVLGRLGRRYRTARGRPRQHHEIARQIAAPSAQ